MVRILVQVGSEWNCSGRLVQHIPVWGNSRSRRRVPVHVRQPMRGGQKSVLQGELYKVEGKIWEGTKEPASVRETMARR